MLVALAECPTFNWLIVRNTKPDQCVQLSCEKSIGKKTAPGRITAIVIEAFPGSNKLMPNYNSVNRKPPFSYLSHFNGSATKVYWLRTVDFCIRIQPVKQRIEVSLQGCVAMNIFDLQE